MKTDPVSTIAKFGGYAMVGVGFIIVAIFGATWWLDPKDSWLRGAFCIAFLWGSIFNKLPTQGLACLKDQFNMRFVLPLAILSSIGFAIGFLDSSLDRRPLWGNRYVGFRVEFASCDLACVVS